MQSSRSGQWLVWLYINMCPLTLTAWAWDDGTAFECIFFDLFRIRFFFIQKLSFEEGSTMWCTVIFVPHSLAYRLQFVCPLCWEGSLSLSILMLLRVVLPAWIVFFLQLIHNLLTWQNSFHNIWYVSNLESFYHREFVLLVSFITIDSSIKFWKPVLDKRKPNWSFEFIVASLSYLLAIAKTVSSERQMSFFMEAPFCSSRRVILLGLSSARSERTERFIVIFGICSVSVSRRRNQPWERRDGHRKQIFVHSIIATPLIYWPNPELKSIRLCLAGGGLN